LTVSVTPIVQEVRQGLEQMRLSPLQRTMMAADGTLSTLIEAYTGDTLSIRKLDVTSWPHPNAVLDRTDDEPIETRAVLISGERLGPVLFAVTTLVPGRLDGSIREVLERTQTAIGKLMVSRKYETFREVLNVHMEPALGHARLLGVAPDARVLVRTYRIFRNGRPLMAITETFRYERFLELPE